MLEDILERPSDAEMIERGLLPHGCALNLETALTYARMTKKEIDGDVGYLKANDCIDVVIEHLQEIKKKLEGAK